MFILCMGAMMVVILTTRNKLLLMSFAFFVQAKGGIRYLTVTGVQTCALPIFGMTCIGGFDGVQCAALARLDAAREAIYVILLGVPDESAIKHDRLRIAYSHGYTTEEG